MDPARSAAHALTAHLTLPQHGLRASPDASEAPGPHTPESSLDLRPRHRRHLTGLPLHRRYFTGFPTSSSPAPSYSAPFTLHIRSHATPPPFYGPPYVTAAILKGSLEPRTRHRRHLKGLPRASHTSPPPS
ncbi:hypothetical protein NDU88_000473 [Pleurodeles waltl]|uniref:Uncharacterized protein n=1 Tax=Pleurodeles waltl TaxID=8319 RepID=A0AAV7SWM4_PLEWA|nr:hypothetical protein NDU88_000473 [Pleurodeles waltl]